MDNIFKFAGVAHVACVGIMDSFGFHPPPTLGSHLALFGLIFAIALIVAELLDLWRSWRLQVRTKKYKEKRSTEARARRLKKKQVLP